MPILIAAALLAAPTAASALNLHNGYIFITNDSNFTVTVNIHHVFLGGKGNDVGPSLVITPHSTGLDNDCCIAAGSEYLIQAHWTDDKIVIGPDIMRGSGAYSPLRVTPRLCNQHGIPFGYAHVKTSLQPYSSSKNGQMTVSRLDVSCP
jgi:hypothetical protein